MSRRGFSFLFGSTTGPSAAGVRLDFPALIGTREPSHACHHPPLRRCRPDRSAELTRKANETLVPKLEKLPGFKGYFLIEAGNGVFSSLNLFETPEQGIESTEMIATWIRDEKLETFIPNEPKITSGKVVVHSDRVLVAA